MKLVLLSDMHGLYGSISIPNGDLLICAGDFSNTGALDEISQFNKFLGKLPHRYKVVIAGNHDTMLETYSYSRNLLSNCTYLQDELIVVEGIKIYGTPWQPEFCNWAFNLKRGKELRDKWSLIPEDTDILVTHGPPMGIQDKISKYEESLGCSDLLDRVKIVQPSLHIFGHIHGSYGSVEIGRTKYINASICTEEYMATNLPVELEI